MHNKSFMDTALIAAKKASKPLLKHFGKKESVKTKANNTLVGAADIEANNLIIGEIKKAHPSHSILSEETGFEDNNSDYKWVIDPLDGTHNFLHGIPIFGTSIALEHRNEVIMGVLHFPVSGMTVSAEKGKGAFINRKRINTSKKKDLEHSFVLFEFSYANRKEKTEFLERFVHKTIDVRNFGSAIYNLMLISCGCAESYVVLSTNEWDVAAGFLIVQEAGGKITGLKGQKWNFDEKRYVISNGHVHDEMLKIFNFK